MWKVVLRWREKLGAFVFLIGAFQEVEYLQHWFLNMTTDMCFENVCLIGLN